jgi:hypothetical protein
VANLICLSGHKFFPSFFSAGNVASDSSLVWGSSFPRRFAFRKLLRERRAIISRGGFPAPTLWRPKHCTRPPPPRARSLILTILVDAGNVV